ncbi:MAG: SDR family oxidoreductase [Phycisphaeraceae bacterium]
MRILITGGTGQLGPYIARRLLRDGHELTLWSQSWTQSVEGITPRCVDLEDAQAMERALSDAAPEAIVHAAALSQIASCHGDPQKAHRINVQATAWLGALRGAPPCRDGALIYLSTDLVFDGEQGDYRETDAAHPSSVYGRTKFEGEQTVLASSRSRPTVLRLPLILGPSLTGRPKFFDTLIASLKEGKPITLFDDEWRTPLGADQAADAVALALTHRLEGLYHVAGGERLSRYEIGVIVAAALGVDASCIQRASRLSMKGPEPRPRDTSLNSDKWRARFPSFETSNFESTVCRLLG